jgi:hypothetical protein
MNDLPAFRYPILSVSSIVAALSPKRLLPAVSYGGHFFLMQVLGNLVVGRYGSHVY